MKSLRRLILAVVIALTTLLEGAMVLLIGIFAWKWYTQGALPISSKDIHPQTGCWFSSILLLCLELLRQRFTKLISITP
jgi:hypothetical protein